ncbi:MAG: hypothetical protein ACLFWB_13235 [Armatimonadota bacterium]
MPREVMQRTAADNEYLHQDFHGALSTGLQYLQDTCGPEAVIEWLKQIADTLYAPLKEELRQRGLVAVRDYLQQLYEDEGGEVEMQLADDELRVHVRQCPAVTHMRENGYEVADMWVETTRTIYSRLTEDTRYSFELLEYDERTGETRMRFYGDVT